MKRARAVRCLRGYDVSLQGRHLLMHYNLPRAVGVVQGALRYERKRLGVQTEWPYLLPEGGSFREATSEYERLVAFAHDNPEEAERALMAAIDAWWLKIPQDVERLRQIRESDVLKVLQVHGRYIAPRGVPKGARTPYEIGELMTQMAHVGVPVHEWLGIVRLSQAQCGIQGKLHVWQDAYDQWLKGGKFNTPPVLAELVSAYQYMEAFYAECPDTGVLSYVRRSAYSRWYAELIRSTCFQKEYVMQRMIPPLIAWVECPSYSARDPQGLRDRSVRFLQEMVALFSTFR